MPLRKLNMRAVKPFDYGLGAPVIAQMADIGRALGSASIGVAVQTVRPGRWSSRRRRHLFQEEILIVIAGIGTLHHGIDSSIAGNAANDAAIPARDIQWANDSRVGVLAWDKSGHLKVIKRRP